MNIDKNVLGDADLKKLEYLGNAHAMKVIEEFVALCKPAKVTVITDSREDIDYVRQFSIRKGEESKLAMEGHTIHFDGYRDLARDKKSTRVLVTGDMKMSSRINSMDRDEGLTEILGLMDGIMKGKEALVRFFCLGPLNSPFSISALQFTDSGYVGHSEDILYRSGYEQFKRLNGSDTFFSFVHSAGRLNERGNTLDIDKRRIYIDVKVNRVLTINNQYAGNSVGLKKLALRLAIYNSNQQDWLAEHMFVMGIKPEGKNRKTYFTGAFPSACGKTSTAMIPGQSIVGDDIAYLKIDDDGKPCAVNIEQGIFGIIEDVNPVDDPVIYKALTTPRELIFSNVLIKDNVPYWLGMGKDIPEEGSNYYGDWKKGMKDEDGVEVLPAHKNARYTIRLQELENVDDRLDDPAGVAVEGVIYGGRDSDTSVPVYQSFDWQHGVFIGASLESETTAATIGQAGLRNFDPMANIDFLVVPLGQYISNHLKFGKRLKNAPPVFATNYFLKKEGKFLNDKVDKKVWILWAEGRVHGEYDAIETPIGYIPRYEDVKALFRNIFNKDFTQADYDAQFSIRTEKFIEKLDRIEKIYNEEKDIPEEFYATMEMIRKRLKDAEGKSGKTEIPPAFFSN